MRKLHHYNHGVKLKPLLINTNASPKADSTVLTSYSTILLLAKSALLPESAITILGLACLCNSFTHDLARLKVS